LNVLILRQGSRDFFWKTKIQELDHEEVALDIHHIFPKAWCEQPERAIKPAIFNSVINKTPISYKANRMIGGKAPSDYLKAIQNHKQVGLADAAMDAILESHFINPTTLRQNDFPQFFEARRIALLKIIEEAMGKTIEATNLQALHDEEETAAEEELA
jgi:hypothetical protein